MSTDLEKIADFHVRLGNLEQLVSELKSSARVPNSPWIICISGALALILCLLGLGLPNHYYQPLFAVLITSLAYHQSWIPRVSNWYEWLFLFLNCLILSMLLKVFLGGGDPRPLFWLSYPTIEGNLSSLSLQWNESSLAQLALPLSSIQGFFFVLLLFSAAIQFQLLASLLAMFLIALSLPSITDFNWNWMLPAFIFGGVYFYLLLGRLACQNPSLSKPI